MRCCSRHEILHFPPATSWYSLLQMHTGIMAADICSGTAKSSTTQWMGDYLHVNHDRARCPPSPGVHADKVWSGQSASTMGCTAIKTNRFAPPQQLAVLGPKSLISLDGWSHPAVNFTSAGSGWELRLFHLTQCYRRLRRHGRWRTSDAVRRPRILIAQDVIPRSGRRYARRLPARRWALA